MRAIVLTQYGGPEVLSISQVPDPEPGPGQALVRVRATSLNRADVLQRMGRYPEPDPKPTHEILGLDIAGEVAESPSGTFRPGDRVMALVAGGGYAEYAVVPERTLLPVPHGWSYEQAAAFPEVFYTAYDALTQIQVGVGDVVLVHAAASGVGSSAVQLLSAMGAQAMGTVGTAEKAARVLTLGAVRAIDYHQEDFVAVCREFTGGRGVDGIVDLVGASYFERNLQVLARQGRQIVVGTVGGARATVALDLLLGKRLTVIGTSLRSRPPEEKMALAQAVKRHVWPLCDTGRIAPVIDRVYPWAEARDAHRRMESNLNIGKIVLSIS